ncbi:MAG: dihydropteroate synthase-like protein [ANME-2 cluster archaeon]|jgi:dihydropteroate synthase-like protein|nr:dihydropteroate synthase-like protein [ANME-2 cluster archaeon]
MQILVVTGRKAAETVNAVVGGFADVLVLDIDVAAFTTPLRLENSMPHNNFDLIIIPGLVSADFSHLEMQLKTPIRLGPKNAVDLGLVLSSIEDIELSTTVPACEMLQIKRMEAATSGLKDIEAAATSAFLLRNLKIGGNSIMKVMGEVVDATSLSGNELVERVMLFQAKGADIIDLGVGMAATFAEVEHAVTIARGGAAVPLSIDTLDPQLIMAAVDSGVDMVLSLNSTNMEEVGAAIARKGLAAVVIPDNDQGGQGLDSLVVNIARAQEFGISRILADPVLDPPGQGMVESMVRYKRCRELLPDIPMFFGAGNITELMDADTVGVNALLTAISHDVGADVLFTPEYSDKARGSISELKTAAGMMALAAQRSSPPKDLGIDLLQLKEKRFRPFDVVPDEFIEAEDSYQWTRDPAGSFSINISRSSLKDGVVEKGRIIARHTKYTIVGDNAKEIMDSAIELGLVSRLDHAGYLGKELMRAELALKLGRSYAQDDEF